MDQSRKTKLKIIEKKKKHLKFKRKLRPWVKVSFATCMLLLVFTFFNKTLSRYYDSMVNGSDLPLAPWEITINDYKITAAGKVNVNVEPVITETTTQTKTYKNKMVPGCKGYFDVEINPTGTGVSIDYEINFNPENLPGGMVYTKYETLDASKNVTNSFTTLPSDSKLTGTMRLVDGNLLGSENILRYRVYFDYIDDDALNTISTDVNHQNSVMIDVTLKQSI